MPSEEFEIRSGKLAEIRSLGIDPYPAKFTPTYTARALEHKFASKEAGTYEEAEAGKTEHATLAGRIVLFRAMGKNAFAHIQDTEGRFQLLFNRDHTQVAGLPPGELTPLKFIEKKLDLGDIIGVEGHLFRTQTGELTLFVKTVTLLCKTLLSLPDKHSGLTDKEQRYRKRWLDLICNPEVKETFLLRSKIIHLIRSYCHTAGFVEVETPVLQTIYGGAEARPFITELNALHQKMYLRIALEISLKKLIVGGMDKIFEIAKVFRNEGLDRTHNPEFTMLEAYAAYWDYNDMMVFTEKLFEQIALELFGTTKIEIDNHTINLAAPWKRMRMTEAILTYGNIDVEKLSDEELRALLPEKPAGSRGILIALLFETFAEKHLIQPHHIIDHPIETTPLCKLHRDPELRRQKFVERFESFILGSEMCNSYTELNDPELQRRLLTEQAEKRTDEAHPMDEEFIEAIEQGMPPTGGLGIGIDRLVMLFTKAASIRDVLFFPLMRVETAASYDGHFHISPPILEKYPLAKFGVLVGKEVNNQLPSPEITALLRSIEAELKTKYTPDTLPTLPKIADWREAYRQFGFSPSAHRSSVEALLRRVIQGKELPSINPLVNLYNYISLKYLLPAGGDDLDKVEGELFLTFADGTEQFIMLGSDKPEPIKKGEVIYRDQKEVTCRSWNYRECEKTKITTNTRHVCLILEGLEHTAASEIRAAIGELKALLTKYCPGSYQEHFLDKDHFDIKL
jgi:lysyl-tRNA synthetase class 2